MGWMDDAGWACFNEAPALRGGNRRPAHVDAAVVGASMRPPHCAGEITMVWANPANGRQLQ